MKHWMTIVLVALFSWGVANPSPADTLSVRDAEPIVFRRAIERVAKAVVKIVADSTRLPVAVVDAVSPGSLQDERFDVGPFISYAVAEGPSTGVVYSPDGLIVTSSFHFVRTPSRIEVRLHDGRSYPAMLLGRDQVRKLAFLRINASDLPVPKWTMLDQVQVGMRAIALGWGFGGSQVAPSVGIVSAVNRMGGCAIQTDANLSPANYGGPLIDLEGRVLGICVPMGTQPGETAGAELYDSGIGFAIGGWTLAEVAPLLASGGNVYRGFVGIRISDAEKAGALIVGVADSSPAKDIGLRAGDRVVQIDNHYVGQVHTLLRHMNYRSAGETVQLVVQRGQGQMVAKIVLTALKDLGDWVEEPPAASSRPAASAPGAADLKPTP